MVVYNETNIQQSSINQKPNNTMLVMLCTTDTCVKKNSCLVARIVLLNTAGLWWPISLIRNNHCESEYEFEIEFKIEFEVQLK